MIKKLIIAIVLSTIALCVFCGMFLLYRSDITPTAIELAQEDQLKQIVTKKTFVGEVERIIQEMFEYENDENSNNDENGDNESVSDNEENNNENNENNEENEEKKDEEKKDEDKETEHEDPKENFSQKQGYWTAKINASSQHSVNPQMKAITYDDKEYYFESQSGAPWNTYQATGGSYVTKAGCMLYAIAQAKSNMSGEVFSVKNVIESAGFDVVQKNSNYYNTGGRRLAYVGNNGGMLDKALSGAKLSKSNCQMTAAGIKASLQAGNMILAHITNEPNPRVISSGGDHWFCFAGYKDGKYLILSSSAKRSGWMSEQTLAVAFTKLNHAYNLK